MRVWAVVLGLTVSEFCCAAQAASLPLAQSGRALSEEPSVSARATALEKWNRFLFFSGEPAGKMRTGSIFQRIVYLPDGGFTSAPARLSRAYRVDTTRAVLFVQPSALK